ncbi:MAG TPA: Rrf2 family transcriptional regulator [Chloroflexota bacterium]|nr:Rrf2 family transcriptional regulator [Chloroflexota bacterium]
MKVDYAVRALIELADTFGSGTKQSADIAERWNIPAPYLDQLLTALRKAGLVVSVRGPQGGHALARNPAGISVREVFEALEGPLQPIDCLEDNPRCAFSRACAIQDLWAEVQASVSQLLGSVTIGELARKQTEASRAAMYYI